MTGIEQADTAPAVIFEEIIKTFHSPSGKVAALDGLSFSVGQGEAVALMGPSSCGKSTAIGLLAGHNAPTTGNIYFQGTLVDGPDRNRGVMFQEDTLLPFRRVIDNVAFGAEVAAIQSSGPVRRLATELRAIATLGSHRWIRRASEAELKRLRDALTSVGMLEFAEKWPRELSGGMRKRVELARVLLEKPTLLALDEPFSRLDAFAREELQALVESLWLQTRCTLLVVTHDWLEAVRLADRVVLMTNRPGRVHSIISIDLPRPRNREVVASPEFARLARQVHDAITEIAAVSEKVST